MAEGAKDGSHHAGRSVVLSLFGNGLAGTAGTAAALYSFNSTAPVIGFVRLVLGALSLLILAPFFGGKFRQLPRLLIRPGVWVMALTSAMYQAFFFAAVERAGVATAALVTVGCIPVSAGVVGWIVLRERLRPIWFVATAIGISGLAVASLGELQTQDSQGLLFAVAAGTGIGGYLTAAKVEIRAGGHPMQLPGMAYLIGSFGLFFIVRSDLIQVQWNSHSFAVALYLGVVTMGLANAMQILGLHGIAPGVAATMMLTDPVVAAVLGVVALNQELTQNGAIGLGLVAVGLIMQSLSPTGKAATTQGPGRHKKL